MLLMRGSGICHTNMFFLCLDDRKRTTLRLAAFTPSAIEVLAQGKKKTRPPSLLALLGASEGQVCANVHL